MAKATQTKKKQAIKIYRALRDVTWKFQKIKEGALVEYKCNPMPASFEEVK